MMTLEQIRERNRKENAAARRLQAAGYRLEGWDPRTGQSGPAPPPSIPPGISRNTKRGLHHDHPQRCPGLLPHAGQPGL